MKAVLPRTLCLLALFMCADARAQPAVFARAAGGAAADDGAEVAVDRDGNSCVAGNVGGRAVFGGGTAHERVFEDVGSQQDAFLAKFDRAGALRWVRRIGGPSYDGASGVAVDSEGRCYIVGQFRETAVFGQGEPNETALVAAALSEIFVAKYDRDGHLLWAKQTGGSNARPDGDLANDVAVDPEGGAYVTGTFSGASVFGPGEANQTVLQSARTEMFMARYAADGRLRWARQAAGTIDDFGVAVAADREGNGYVTGTFRSRTTFGGGEPNATTLALSGGAVEGMFLAKYAPDGALRWARQAYSDTPSASYGAALAVDRTGRAVVGGTFGGTLKFATRADEAGLTLSDGRSFLVVYDAAGTPIWAQAITGTTAALSALDVDRSGSIHAVGSYSERATFGAGDGALTLTSPPRPPGTAAAALFLARYRSDGTVRTARSFGGPSARAAGVAVDRDGGSYVVGSFTEPAAFDGVTLTSAGSSDVFFAKFSALEPLTVRLTMAGSEWMKTLTAVPGELTRLVLLNGRPGLTAVAVMVNDRLRTIAPIESGKRYERDLTGDLRPGRNNVVRLLGIGRRGAFADLTLTP